MSLPHPRGNALPEGAAIVRASQSAGEHDKSPSLHPAAGAVVGEDFLLDEEEQSKDQTNNHISASVGMAALNHQQHQLPNYSTTPKKRKKLVTGARTQTTKKSRKRHISGSVDDEDTIAGRAFAVVAAAPNRAQSMEYLNLMDQDYNCLQQSHLSLASAAQRSASTLDDNFTTWGRTDAQTWLQRQLPVSHLSSKRGDRLHTTSQEQLQYIAPPAACVGPVHPMQPLHLSSMLALQRARRIAAAQQQYILVSTSNPLAIKQPPLQREMIIDTIPPRPTLNDFLPMTPGGRGIPGPTFPPWWSCSRQGLSPLFAPPHLSLSTAAETVFHQMMNLVSTANLLQEQGAGRSLLALTQPQLEHAVASTLPLQTACITVHVTGNSGDGIAQPASSAAGERMIQMDRPTYYATESIGPDVPLSLPTIIFQPVDEDILSPYQILLRNQIEVFSASADDADTHTRGRNKPIMTGQVGIRCRHCSCLAVNRRKKGAVYFPFSLVGLYQAAQNMGQSHFNQQRHSACSEMPQEVKKQFLDGLVCKSGMGSGKLYWARSAKSIGLVDTAEHGIRFIRHLVAKAPD